VVAVADVLDDGVASREEQAFVAVVVPPHEERWGAVLTVYFQDLCAPVGLTDVMALDDETITDVCSHDTFSCSLLRSVTQSDRWIAATAGSNVL
jgi:hypothetical protein